MRTLKNLKAAIVILMLSVIVGCSEGPVSPLSSESNSGTVNSNSELSKVPANNFHTTMMFKPGQRYTFNRSNTGINTFHALSIKNSYKKELEVVGYVGGLAFLLEPNTKGFTAASITIENKAASPSDLDIYLAGDVELIDPWVNDKQSE